MTLAQMAKLLNHHSLADHENLAHLLPSTKLMIIARKNSHIQHNHATKRCGSAFLSMCIRDSVEGVLSRLLAYSRYGKLGSSVCLVRVCVFVDVYKRQCRGSVESFASLFQCGSAFLSMCIRDSVEGVLSRLLAYSRYGKLGSSVCLVRVCVFVDVYKRQCRGSVESFASLFQCGSAFLSMCIRDSVEGVLSRLLAYSRYGKLGSSVCLVRVCVFVDVYKRQCRGSVESFASLFQCGSAFLSMCIRDSVEGVLSRLLAYSRYGKLGSSVCLVRVCVFVDVYKRQCRGSVESFASLFQCGSAFLSMCIRDSVEGVLSRLLAYSRYGKLGSSVCLVRVCVFVDVYKRQYDEYVLALAYPLCCMAVLHVAVLPRDDHQLG
ncbi:hypothetical protein DEO72_LG5g3277 [Vigna unguiculata]|uniref:Uncharacterized protein n=1 Tax=Vigna unguiculata TaxID=3917 RepID=A0A4D6M5C4_VIGUN|nr:hypothetical protein DEO72_LG5g3277 [Vigna unguiculata]